MGPRLTVAQLEQLRRDAKKLARTQPQLSHHQVLDQMAQSQGFQNWSLLAKHVEDGGVEPVKRRIAYLPHRAPKASEAAGHGRLRMEATRSEIQLILAIVKRFEAITEGGVPLERLTLVMDVEACHCNGCPLDLEALANAARDVDLVHDVAGIHRHLNRETGELEDCFRPRYASRVGASPLAT